MRQGRSCVVWVLLTGAFVLACQQEPEPGEARLTEAISAGSEGAEPPPAPRHHGPPKEAFAACEGKAVDAACTVAMGPDSIEGICRKGPEEDSELVCVPKNFPPPPGHHGPPKEALAACEGKAVDAACTVAMGANDIEGICRKGPGKESVIVCVPEGFPPRPHHHGPPKEAFEACEGKVVDAACTVAVGPHSFDGTCRQGPAGEGALACEPDKAPRGPRTQ